MRKLLLTSAIFICAILIQPQVLIAQTTVFQENFNSGLTVSWTTTSGPNVALFPWAGKSGAPGLSDHPVACSHYGSSLPTNEILTSPAFDAFGFSTVFLSYDYYFGWQNTSLEGFVDVYDGDTWQNVAHYFGKNSSDSYKSSHENIDVTAYSNTDMQVRFRFVNAVGTSWAHDFVVDNIVVTGNTTTNVASITSDTKINVYPNPSENVLFVSGLEANATYKIHNSLGQLVMQGNYNSNGIIIENLTAGVYVLQSNEASIKIQKID